MTRKGNRLCHTDEGIFFAEFVECGKEELIRDPFRCRLELPGILKKSIQIVVHMRGSFEAARREEAAVRMKDQFIDISL